MSNTKQRKVYVGLGVLYMIIALLISSSRVDQNTTTILSQQQESQGIDQITSIVTKPQIEMLRPLSILALGGSVTWGGGVKREESYSFRLSEFGHHVINLALRGTGSDYPAQCIYSMLHEVDTYDPNVPFDVIILEFSVNGMRGFSLLMKRLRQQYPDAIFIYVDLFSLKTGRGQFDSTNAHQIVKEYNGIIYFFGHLGEPTDEFNFQELDRKNPPKFLRELYGPDRHHLNSKGHEFVMKNVHEIIESQVYPPTPRIGSWIGGDECVSWYEDGLLGDIRIVKKGDGMRAHQFDKKKKKWAVEIDQRDGTILEYHHKGHKDAPINIQFMTKCAEPDDTSSSIYPSVVVHIEQDPLRILNARHKATKSKVILQRKDDEDVRVLEGWKYLSGLHQKIPSRRFHVTDIRNIGIVKPGVNYIYVYEVESHKPSPFRITSTITCEACGQLGYKSLEWV